MSPCNLANVAPSRQEVFPPDSTNSQLNPAAKRLLLSAHLGLVWKKLRQGLPVEDREILALLPFTVSNGWRADEEISDESRDDSVAPDGSDEDWSQRVANAGALR